MATAEKLGDIFMSITSPTEPSAQQLAHEELAYTAQCDIDNSYDRLDDEAMLGFCVVDQFDCV